MLSHIALGLHGVHSVICSREKAGPNTYFSKRFLLLQGRVRHSNVSILHNINTISWESLNDSSVSHHHSLAGKNAAADFTVNLTIA